MIVVLSTLAISLAGPPAGACSSISDLGAGRSLTLFTPQKDLSAENAEIAQILGVDIEAVAAQRGALENFDDAEGQKIWPSSLAFARMLTQSASAQVKDLDVIELGCGLGGVGISAALAGARSVLLTDFQPASLELARAAAAENGVADRCEFKLLDWTAPVPDDLGGPFDVVLGSDVLYDRTLTGNLLDVVASLITGRPRDRSRPEPRAMLVDPAARPSRPLLPELCASRGLYWGGETPVREAEESGTVLINLLPA